MIGPCEYCGLWCNELHEHHIITRGAGGPEHRLNKLWLGGPWDCNDHGKFHAGHIKRADLLEIVAKREGYPSGQHVLERLWKMIRVVKKGKLPAEKKPRAKVIFGGTCNKCGAEVECDQSAALRGGVRCKTKEGKVRCFTWIKVSFKRKEEPK